MTAANTAPSLDELVDLLRRNGYSPVGVVSPGGTVVHPGLVRHHAGMATQLVLPVYGDATVVRTRCSLDQAQPGLLITSVEFCWTNAQATVALWLLREDGVLPKEEDQP